MPDHPRPPGEAVDDILRRAEFRGPSESLIDRARSWIFEQIERALGAAVEGGAVTLLGWVLVAAAVVGAVAFAVRFSRTVQRDRSLAPVVVGPPVRPAADWLADAAAHEAGGDWRAGLRCRYRALVAELAASGLLEEVPGRTTGEYRAELTAALPAAASDFADATRLFERAWYGRRPTGPDESQTFERLAGAVLAARTQRRRPARAATS